MNKESLVFHDKAFVVPCKISKSEIRLQNELNLIEYKTVIQSDNFSYVNEEEKIVEAKEINSFNKLSSTDFLYFKKIKNTDVINQETILSNDKFINDFSEQGYKIVCPIPDTNFSTGENIYFECAMITDNVLLKEEFDKIVWFSSLDGLIGIKKCFQTMLSSGEHFITIMLIENNNQIIKDEIKIYVSSKPTIVPEI